MLQNESYIIYMIIVPTMATTTEGTTLATTMAMVETTMATVGTTMTETTVDTASMPPTELCNSGTLALSCMCINKLYVHVARWVPVRSIIP